MPNDFEILLTISMKRIPFPDCTAKQKSARRADRRAHHIPPRGWRGRTAAGSSGGIQITWCAYSGMRTINGDADRKITLVDSTVSMNSSAADGGGLYNGAGVTLTITNSTISDNAAAGSGGGVYSARLATVALDSVTIAGN